MEDVQCHLDLFCLPNYFLFFSLAEFKANVLSNMSVSLAHIKTNDGNPVLSWNLTVPCRIRVKMWPCQLKADGKCTEVEGFRQKCCNDWRENRTILWVNIHYMYFLS